MVLLIMAMVELLGFLLFSSFFLSIDVKRRKSHRYVIRSNAMRRLARTYSGSGLLEQAGHPTRRDCVESESGSQSYGLVVKLRRTLEI